MNVEHYFNSTYWNYEYWNSMLCEVYAATLNAALQAKPANKTLLPVKCHVPKRSQPVKAANTKAKSEANAETRVNAQGVPMTSLGQRISEVVQPVLDEQARRWKTGFQFGFKSEEGVLGLASGNKNQNLKASIKAMPSDLFIGGSITKPMTSTAVMQLAETVIQQRIPGAFMETGVWRGGMSLAMAAVAAAHGYRV